MEVRSVNTDHAGAPSNGMGTYVVVDEGEHKVTLFHPWSLSEFVITREEYLAGQGPMLWPDNASGVIFDVKKVVQILKTRVRFFASIKRSFPESTTKRVWAALEGVKVADIEAVMPEKRSADTSGTSKVSRWQLARKLKKDELAEFKGRRKEILEVLVKGPATVTAISDVIKYQPKTRVAQDPVKVKEREVHWALQNDLRKKGLVKPAE
jgi:hypothetical protein